MITRKVEETQVGMGDILLGEFLAGTVVDLE